MVLGAIFCGPPVRYAHSLAECPVALSRGQFFGTRFQIFILIRLYARNERPQAPPEPPRHSHASSHFVLVVKGNVHHRSAQSGPFCMARAGSSTTRIGTTHRDRFHNGCGRFLTTTPPATVARMLDARSPVSLVIHQPGAIAVPARTRTLICCGFHVATTWLMRPRSKIR
jgi:hypothetical protein